MKKLIFVFATLVAMSFASCGGNTTSVANDSIADTAVVVDSATVDSVTVDSVSIDSIAE